MNLCSYAAPPHLAPPDTTYLTNFFYKGTQVFLACFTQLWLRDRKYVYVSWGTFSCTAFWIYAVQMWEVFTPLPLESFSVQEHHSGSQCVLHAHPQDARQLGRWGCLLLGQTRIHLCPMQKTNKGDAESLGVLWGRCQADLGPGWFPVPGCSGLDSLWLLSAHCWAAACKSLQGCLPGSACGVNSDMWVKEFL